MQTRSIGEVEMPLRISSFATLEIWTTTLGNAVNPV
jgi:hypothetical protein